MTPIQVRVLIAVLAISFITACGGGGGGGSSSSSGSGGGNNTAPGEPSIAIDVRNFSVSASAWDAAQQRSAILTVTNMPAAGAWVEIYSTNRGVSYADLVAPTATNAQIAIQFRAGTQMQPGTYQDTITISVCRDDQCAQHFRNSPIVINTTLVVTGESSISPEPGTVSVTASKRTPGINAPVANAGATIGSPGPVAPHVELVGTSTLVESVRSVVASANGVRFDLAFRSPVSLQPGTHEQTLLLRACYDSTCARQLTGSPFSVPISYIVTNDAPAETGIDPVPFLSRIALPHNVIDSEFSKQLGAVVMVSSYPRNSLYLFDVATQAELEIALNKPPHSVSISPDGLQAAVGHDALVSVIDLAELAQTGTATPVLLTTTTVAFDIVLDGNGFVHVFPESDQWVRVHSIEIATNIEGLSTGRSIYDSAHARLHPSGNFIYSANNGLSPGDIEKFDISGGVASYVRDSPYHGDYGMCGNLWIKDDGATIYTRCGNTFRASTDSAQDMLYSGRLTLSPSTNYGFAIESLSQSSITKEIVLIEADTYNCATGIYDDPTRCFMHLAVYESDFLNRLSVHSIAPISVAGRTYAQRGLFVFHSADGAHRYMISRLAEISDRTAEYYLTILN